MRLAHLLRPRPAGRRRRRLPPARPLIDACARPAARRRRHRPRAPPSTSARCTRRSSPTIRAPARSARCRSARSTTAATSPPRGAGARTPLFYRHPMRPDVTSPVPAKDEMGMDYIPVYADDAAGRRASDVAGHAAFTLSRERQQLIGVRRGRVERRRCRATSAPSAPSPTTRSSTRRSATTGRRSPGAPACSDEALPEAREGSDAIARAAALRLRQLGLSDAQIRDIGARRRRPGALLLPGATAWVYAQVYEYEIGRVRPGQQVTVTVAVAGRPRLPRHRRGHRSDPRRHDAHRAGAGAGGDARRRPAAGVVRHRDRSTCPPRRSSRCRATPCSTPASDQYRVRRRGDGTLRRRAPCGSAARPAAGTRSLDGVEPGDEVVTSANFLIDSESRFRAALRLAPTAVRRRRRSRRRTAPGQRR